ncbi:M20/M25/M40 family metallo-hydrolase [bacterium]|nr:M20/M25/M40 family metallo-hydrolase [bacterium]
MTPMFDQQLCEELVMQLAATPGPSLNEGPRIACIAGFLNSHRVACTTDSAGSLWAFFGPDDWPGTIVLDAHIDVVGQGVAHHVQRSENKIIGAGVFDDLAAAALLMLLAVRLSHSTVDTPIAIVFSVGEEGLGNLKGMRRMVADRPRPPRLLISFDMSPAEYSVAALGSVRYRVSFKGAGGHSWGDFGRASATEELVDFLAAVKAGYRHAAADAATPVSYNIGTLRGGEGINCISRAADAEFEFRSASPGTLAAMTGLLNDTIEMHKACGCEIGLEIIGERPAVMAPRDTWYERLVLETWTLNGVAPRDVCRSTNINVPLAHGWPALCVGLARGGNVHREDEFLLVDSLTEGWTLLNRLIGAMAPQRQKESRA